MQQTQDNGFSLISDDEIKILFEKFKENGFHYSPYEDPNRIWDSYKLLETSDLPKLRYSTFICSCNLGKRLHLFLIKIDGNNYACFLDNGHFYRCQQLEQCFEDSLFYGTLFDGELIYSQDGQQRTFLIYEVLALGGIIQENILQLNRSPPYPVSVDIKPFPLEERLSFARLLFDNPEFYFESENSFCKFEIQTYYHCSEFENIVLRMENCKSQTIIFQGNDFKGIKYIYNIQRVSISISQIEKNSQMFFIVKDKYPGIWKIHDGKKLSEYLYVPSKDCYDFLRTIMDNTQIPCIFNKTQEMWMPLIN